MRVEVLVSVMNLKNTEVLLKQMQIASDVLIINQCNKNEDEFYKNNEYTVRVISTTTRGLSLSRNMALDNAIGDICLLCDDDEVLYSDYREKIVQEFIRNPEADIICFKRDNTKKRYLPIRYRINKMTALHVSSVEIAIKKNKIVEKKFVLTNVLEREQGYTWEKRTFFYMIA